MSRALAVVMGLCFSVSAHAEGLGFEAQVDAVFGALVGYIAAVMFWSIPGTGMPLIVAWLLSGALFFTLRMKFVNVRMFTHAIQCRTRLCPACHCLDRGPYPRGSPDHAYRHP